MDGEANWEGSRVRLAVGGGEEEELELPTPHLGTRLRRSENVAEAADPMVCGSVSRMST